MVKSTFLAIAIAALCLLSSANAETTLHTANSTTPTDSTRASEHTSTPHQSMAVIHMLNGHVDEHVDEHADEFPKAYLLPFSTLLFWVFVRALLYLNEQCIREKDLAQLGNTLTRNASPLYHLNDVYSAFLKKHRHTKNPKKYTGPSGKDVWEWFVYSPEAISAVQYICQHGYDLMPMECDDKGFPLLSFSYTEQHGRGSGINWKSAFVNKDWEAFTLARRSVFTLTPNGIRLTHGLRKSTSAGQRPKDELRTVFERVLKLLDTKNENLLRGLRFSFFVSHKADGTCIHVHLQKGGKSLLYTNKTQQAGQEFIQAICTLSGFATIDEFKTELRNKLAKALDLENPNDVEGILVFELLDKRMVAHEEQGAMPISFSKTRLLTEQTVQDSSIVDLHSAALADAFEEFGNGTFFRSKAELKREEATIEIEKFQTLSDSEKWEKFIHMYNEVMQKSGQEWRKALKDDRRIVEGSILECCLVGTHHLLLLDAKKLKSPLFQMFHSLTDVRVLDEYLDRWMKLMNNVDFSSTAPKSSGKLLTLCQKLCRNPPQDERTRLLDELVTLLEPCAEEVWTTIQNVHQETKDMETESIGEYGQLLTLAIECLPAVTEIFEDARQMRKSQKAKQSRQSKIDDKWFQTQSATPFETLLKSPLVTKTDKKLFSKMMHEACWKSITEEEKDDQVVMSSAQSAQNFVNQFCQFRILPACYKEKYFNSGAAVNAKELTKLFPERTNLDVPFDILETLFPNNPKALIAAILTFPIGDILKKKAALEKSSKKRRNNSTDEKLSEQNERHVKKIREAMVAEGKKVLIWTDLDNTLLFPPHPFSGISSSLHMLTKVWFVSGIRQYMHKFEKGWEMLKVLQEDNPDAYVVCMTGAPIDEPEAQALTGGLPCFTNVGTNDPAYTTDGQKRAISKALKKHGYSVTGIDDNASCIRECTTGIHMTGATPAKVRPKVITLRGPPGSGKSTFVAILTSLLKARGLKVASFNNDLYRQCDAGDKTDKSFQQEVRDACRRDSPFHVVIMDTMNLKDECGIANNPDFVVVFGPPNESRTPALREVFFSTNGNNDTPTDTDDDGVRTTQAQEAFGVVAKVANAIAVGNLYFPGASDWLNILDSRIEKRDKCADQEDIEGSTFRHCDRSLLTDMLRQYSGGMEALVKDVEALGTLMPLDRAMKSANEQTKLREMEKRRYFLVDIGDGHKEEIVSQFVELAYPSLMEHSNLKGGKSGFYAGGNLSSLVVTSLSNSAAEKNTASAEENTAAAEKDTAATEESTVTYQNDPQHRHHITIAYNCTAHELVKNKNGFSGGKWNGTHDVHVFLDNGNVQVVVELKTEGEESYPHVTLCCSQATDAQESGPLLEKMHAGQIDEPLIDAEAKVELSHLVFEYVNANRKHATLPYNADQKKKKDFDSARIAAARKLFTFTWLEEDKHGCPAQRNLPSKCVVRDIGSAFINNATFTTCPW